MEWYEEWFDRAEYQLVYQHRNDDDALVLIDTIEETVSPAPNDTVLDVGCGRGRHSVLLKKRGFDVTGIDLSSGSIHDAKIRAEQEKLDIHFEVRDMRDAYCDGCFDGVVNLFTAFGYFVSDYEHTEALRSMSEAVRPGGWFVQDFLNAPYVEATMVPKDERMQDGLSITQTRWIADGRVNKRISLTGPDGEKTFDESVRLLTLADFEIMYDEVGLELFATPGSYSGEPYTPESPRLILFARRR